MTLIKLSMAILIGLLFDSMSLSASFKNIFETRTNHRRGNFIEALPFWSDLGSVMAQLTLTPALIYYIKNQMQEEVVVLNQKVENMEQTMQNATTRYQEKKSAISQVFSDDMRSAVTTYQRLYGGTNEKIASAMMNDERRSSFEQKLLVSMSEVQDLESAITELRDEGRILRSKVESTVEVLDGTFETLRKQQTDQESKLLALQALEVKDRTLLSRDSKKEQRATASSYSAALAFIRGDVEQLKESARNAAEVEERNRLAAELALLAIVPPVVEDTISLAVPVPLPVPAVGIEELESLLRQVELLEIEVNQTAAALIYAEEEKALLKQAQDRKESDAIKKVNENINNYEKVLQGEIESDRIEKAAMLESYNKKKELENNERNKEISLVRGDLRLLDGTADAAERLSEESDMIQAAEARNAKYAALLVNQTDKLEIENNLQKKSIQEEKQKISVLENLMKNLSGRLFKSEQAAAVAVGNQEKMGNELIPKIEMKVKESNEKLLKVEERSSQTLYELGVLDEVEGEKIMANTAERGRIEEKMAVLSDVTSSGIEGVTKRLDDSRGALEAADKADKNSRIFLKSSQLYANADLVDSVEKLQDKQSSMDERTKISIVRTETDFRKKVQIVSDKIEVDAVGMLKALTRFDSMLSDADSILKRKQNSNSERMKNSERNANNKIEDLSNTVDAIIAETANRGIAEFNREYRTEAARAMDAAQVSEREL